MSYFYKTFLSPVGELTLVADDTALCAILWENDRPGRVKLGPLEYAPGNEVLHQAQRQLEEYFSGTRDRFDMPLSMQGTAFQKRVWELLLSIPFGETRSYRQIAELAGNPKAVRAVGAAVGRNPVSIIAPCHRVLGTTGSLTGFAGGLDAKKALLRLEGHTLG